MALTSSPLTFSTLYNTHSLLRVQPTEHPHHKPKFIVMSNYNVSLIFFCIYEAELNCLQFSSNATNIFDRSLPSRLVTEIHRKLRIVYGPKKLHVHALWFHKATDELSSPDPGLVYSLYCQSALHLNLFLGCFVVWFWWITDPVSHGWELKFHWQL